MTDRSSTTSRDPKSAKRALVKWRRNVVPAAALTLLSLNAIAAMPTAAWLMDLVKHFHLQYAGAALILLALSGVFRCWRCAVAAVLCLVASAIHLWPLYCSSSTAHCQTADQIRLMTANVNCWNPNGPKLLSAIQTIQPDVIALNEVGSAIEPAIGQLVASYPFFLTEVRDDNAGLALLSRLPLSNVQLRKLGESRLLAITATLNLPTGNVDLIVVHTQSPVSPRASALRDRQLRDLAAFVESDADRAVVIGDLNTSMWSPGYKLLAPNAHLANAREGFGVLPTWPAWLPVFMRIPIDHCLHGKHVGVANVMVGPDIGSDHMPLVVDLCAK